MYGHTTKVLDPRVTACRRTSGGSGGRVGSGIGSGSGGGAGGSGGSGRQNIGRARVLYITGSFLCYWSLWRDVPLALMAGGGQAPVQVIGCTNQGQVGEGLRKVSQVFAT